MKPLACSSDHITVSTTTLNGTLELKRPSIVINLSDVTVTVEADGSSFTQLESRLLQQTSVHSKGATILVVQAAMDDFLHMPEITSQFIRENWSYDNPLAVDTVRSAQQAVHASNTLKSAKDTVGEYHIFLCHQLAGVRGRIHRFHELYEIHTQIIGRGMMQKYHDESFDTLFETAHMMPGFTHYPFYNQEKHYPWHTFVADSESVWLAIVRYD